MTDGVNKRKSRHSVENLLEKYGERKSRSSVELLAAQQREEAYLRKFQKHSLEALRQSDPDVRAREIAAAKRELERSEKYREQVLPGIQARKEMLARSALIRDIRSMPETFLSSVDVSSRDPRYVARAMEEAELFRYTPPNARMDLLQESFSSRSKKMERAAAHMMSAEEDIKIYSRAPKDETTEAAVERLRKLTAAQQKYKSSRQTITEGSSFLEEAAGQMAQIRATEREKRRRGWDPETRMLTAQNIVEKEQERQRSVSLQQAVQQGQFSSVSKEQEKLGKIGEELAESFRKLIQAQREFEEGLEGSKEKLEEASKLQDDLNESYKKQSQVVDAIKRQRDERSNMMGSALGIATTTIDTLGHGFITSNIQQQQTRTSMINVYNQQYSDYMAASRGDFASMFQVAGFQDRISQATEMSERQVLWSGGKVVASGVDAAITGAGLTNVLSWGTNTAGQMELANIAAAKAGEAIRGGIDIAKTIPQGQRTLEQYGVEYEMDKAINFIRSQRMGAVVEAGRGFYEATQGAGRAESLFGDVFNTQFLERAKDRGFGTERVASLMAQGVRTIGAPFEKSATSIMERAMVLDQNRTVGAGQFLGMTAQMAQLGGGIKQVEDVIANAFARGAGNAKVFQEMVDSITQMSDRMGGDRGADFTEIITNAMNNATSAIQKAYGGAMNPSQQITLARSDIGRWSELSKSKGPDFGSALKYAKLIEAGADPFVAAQALENIDIYAAKDMFTLAKDPNKKDKFGVTNEEKLRAKARSLRVESILFTEDGKINKKGAQALVEGSMEMIGATGLMSPEVYNQFKSGKLGTRGRDIFGADISSLNIDSSKATIPNKIKPNLEAAQTPDKIAAEAALKNINILGDVSKSFSSSVEELSKNMKNFDPSKIMTDAIQAGTAMKLDAGQFEEGVKDFRAAVDKLSDAVKLMGSDKGKMQSEIDKVQSKASSKASPLDSLGPRGFFFGGSGG